MKIEELRIGNYVKDTKNGIPMYVTGIFAYGTVYLDFDSNEGDLWEYDIKDLVGIKLDEEILLKCGFEKKFATDPQEPNPLIVYYIECFEILKFEDESKFFHSEGRGIHIYITFIHQLQNLYFALTGKELTIKL